MFVDRSDLLDRLRGLSDIAHDLEQQLRDPVVDPDLNLKNLQSAIRSLGRGKAAKPLHCSDDYLSQWKKHLENEDSRLDNRAIRYLCWQPEIALSPRFQHYLDRNNVELNARALQGLVRGCHAQWSPDFASSQSVARVRERVRGYTGGNGVLSNWRDNVSLILGPGGAEKIGAEMTQRLEQIRKCCERWGFGEETSAFVQSAVCHATELCREQLDRIPELRDYLLTELLGWAHWRPDLFKQEVSRTILHSAISQSPELQERVRQFILNDVRLGDPRLPSNALNWVGLSEAEQRVIEWLSKLDIVFFFESVLPRGENPQGRKEFWLQYVSSIKRSRPLLCREDRRRVERDLLVKGLKLAHAGSMDEWSTASAFLLDFGPILVVEFSETGNACYVYHKKDVDKIIAEFWTARPFAQQKLRRRDLDHERIVHRQRKSQWHSGGWEESAAQLLARFNIRPRTSQWSGR